jgi:hypothetical protein
MGTEETKVLLDGGGVVCAIHLVWSCQYACRCKLWR